MGRTDSGTPIEVYKDVVESDFKIAIGNITPHIAVGWGGGAKMIQSGVCSERITEVTHLNACTMQSVLEVCGSADNADNAIRREMEVIAGRVGLDFIINTVLDENKNMLGVFSGHYIKVHRKGIELAKEVMCPKIPKKADVLISSANPCHVDFWQGCKPYIYSQYGVKESGVLIFLIDGKEGLCGSAPRHDAILRKYSLMTFVLIYEDVKNGKLSDIVGINVPLFHARIRNRVTTICVSNGFTQENAECLGFIYAKSINERKQLGWASGDMPDLYFKASIGTNEEIIYGEEGLIVDLSDMIDKYAPNIKAMFEERPDVKKAVTQPSGKICTLPQVAAKNIHPAWYINVVWMDKLGLNMPENPDELYNVLKMFKEGDPNENGINDEIPMSTGNLNKDVKNFMHNFGVLGSHYIDPETDKVVYGPVQPGFKEGLLWFRKIFADGLLDPESINQQGARLTEKGHNNQLGLAHMWASWLNVGYENQLNMDYEVLVPFEVNGRRIHPGSSGIERGCSAITSKNKYPEATLRWLDMLYSFEGFMMAHRGEENVDWRWRDDGLWEVILKEGEEPAQKQAYNSIQPGGCLAWWSDHPKVREFSRKMYSDRPDNYSDMTDRLMPYYYEPYPLVFMNEEDSKNLAIITGDLNTYVHDMMVRFITGDVSIEAEWDNYVSTIHQLGMEELLRLYQKAYDDLK